LGLEIHSGIEEELPHHYCIHIRFYFHFLFFNFYFWVFIR